jgi:hypothetical protein
MAMILGSSKNTRQNKKSENREFNGNSCCSVHVYIISYYLNAQGLATFYTLIELQSLKDHGPPVVMLVSLFVDLLNFILIFFILSRLMAKSREIQKELKEN